MEEVERKRFEISGVRYLFAFNGLLGFFVIYALRMNLNVAIVAMVNNTAVYHNNNTTPTIDECKVEDMYPNNSSSTEHPKDGEFIWSPNMQGIILGAFYYGYCISQIPGGRMADTLSGKWVFGIGNLVTALLTLLTPVAARCHVGLLIAIRAIQGLAQGVTTPAMNSMLGRWLPDTERGLLYTLVHAGTNIGTLVTMSLAGYLSSSDIFGGWPSCFYLIGMFGCLWFLLWCVIVSDSPHTHPFITKRELKYITSNQRIEVTEKLPPIPWMKVMTSVPFWTLIIAQTCQDWSFYTMMTDLPTFFATMLHFRIETNGFLSSVPHFLQTIVGLMVASVADMMIRRGYASTTFVRKFCNSVSGFGGSLGLIAVCLSGCNVNMNVAFFMLSIAIGGFCYSGHEQTLLDLSPEYAGTLYGIANTISNLTGFITPIVVGALTDGNQTLHQWRIVFGITAALLAFASVVFLIFSTTKKQDWATPSDTPKDVILDRPEEATIHRKKYKLLM